MESNWRYNVWDLGLTGTSLKMIARLVMEEPAIPTFIATAALGDGQLWFQPDLDQPPVYYGPWMPPPWAFHFPFGLEVWPD